MSPAELTDEILALLKRDFFGPDAKSFFQQRDLLRQAITYPARYLNDRSARLPATRYRAILLLVIDTIKRKGNKGAIERFSPYFAACVQSHMQHHGDDYVTAAKDLAAGRPVGPLAGRALDALRRRAEGFPATAGDDRTVEVLAEAHRALKSRTRGRIQPAKKAVEQPDLFAPCTSSAKRVSSE